jgi:hypothetical protein
MQRDEPNYAFGLVHRLLPGTTDAQKWHNPSAGYDETQRNEPDYAFGLVRRRARMR